MQKTIKLSKKILSIALSLIIIGGFILPLPAKVSARGLFSSCCKNSLYWTDEGNYDTRWYDDHIQENEFSISKPEQLAGLAVLNNGLNGKIPVDFDNKTIKLTRSIDVSQYLWTPIGLPNKIIGNIIEEGTSKPFFGKFVGGDHDILNNHTDFNTIDGLNIDSNEDYQGLFWI